MYRRVKGTFGPGSRVRLENPRDSLNSVVPRPDPSAAMRLPCPALCGAGSAFYIQREPARISCAVGLLADRWAALNPLSCHHPDMIDWSTCAAVERDRERVSGAWVFRGSRVPVAALFENLEDGVDVGEFVELFPGVTLEQARAVLEHAARSALAAA